MACYMARTTRLLEAIYDYNFVRIARQERHTYTQKTSLGMVHLQEHAPVTCTAKALFVHITTVNYWHNLFRREALAAGLRENSRPVVQ
jgi:hypothetical protein